MTVTGVRVALTTDLPWQIFGSMTMRSFMTSVLSPQFYLFADFSPSSNRPGIDDDSLHARQPPAISIGACFAPLMPNGGLVGTTAQRRAAACPATRPGFADFSRGGRCPSSSVSRYRPSPGPLAQPHRQVPPRDLHRRQ
jgi:hypothetical protein